ncbi:hypothetical protein [Natronorubrum halophilum]|uniref:hypothetical protein n=1 Tax=Natronorubrum halophilum TaxID=1702106 RepID=UPI0010C2061E|nr:hypothetical protein [Natronorubrum halophilum]
MSQSASASPNNYVRENKETLVEIIKHGDDEFVRAMALAALVEFGDDPDLNTLRRELERMTERGGQ